MSSRSSFYRPPTVYRRGTFNPQPTPVLASNDNFPILEFREISICLQECGFIANEELVSKPTGKYIKLLFEQVLEIFTGVSPQSLLALTEQARETEDGGQGDAEAAGANPARKRDDADVSLYNILFYKVAYSFLCDIGFHDLSLLDISRPDVFRTKRILSAIVNYAKFREEHSIDYEKYFDDCEGHFERLNKAESDKIELTNQIIGLKRKFEESENGKASTESEVDAGRKKATLKQTKAYNSKLELELVKLKRIQDDLNLDRSQYRAEKARLSEKLEDNDFLISESRQKLINLQQYVKTDISLHKKVVEELSDELAKHQETVRTLETQNENLGTTIESFKTVENELKLLFKNLEDILKDLANEEQSLAKVEEFNEILSKYKLEALDLTNKIELANTQIAAQRAKKERSDKNFVAKKQQEEAKTVELNEEYHKLLRERQNFEETLNDTNNKIAILENKMKLKRREFDQEYKEAERNIEKMNVHVRKYMREMARVARSEEQLQRVEPEEHS